MGRGLLCAVAILAGLCAHAVAADADERRSSESGRRKDPIEALAIEVKGDTRGFGAVEIEGLHAIAEPSLFEAVRRPAAPFAFAEAAALLRELDQLGAFARIEPLIRVGEAGALTLAVRVEEHPQLRGLVVHGASEVAEAGLLADLVGVAEAPAPWFAGVEGGEVRPGLLRGGLEGAVRRAMAGLFDRGYLMARLSGSLSSEGTLTVELDEGRLGQVRLVGPHDSVRKALLAALDLPAGRTLFEPELADALQRVERALPFLKPDLGPHPTRALPQVVTTSDGAGGQAVSLREGQPIQGASFFGVEGDTLVLYFKPKAAVRFGFNADELLRHTPVGGIGVGVRGDVRFYDPRNRLHLAFDFFTGTVDGDALDTVGVDGGEFDTALRFRAPRLWNAEVSFETHSMIDTSDTWRTARQTSYLNSLFFDLPDSEYYWREGGTLGLTLQPTDELLLGIEHRTDTYHSMPSLANPASIWHPDQPFVNPPVRDGEMGSLLLRAELRSAPMRPEQVRALFRSSESSMVAMPRQWGLRTGYALLATLELSRPGLGSAEGLSFTRFVSDNRVVLATGPESGLKLRARVAGGSTLPPQKEESLGGWSALRGYEFKEYRGGDWLLLGVTEYRHQWLSGFVDIGGLHLPDGWSGPHVGAGLKLHPDSLPVVGRWLRNQRLLPPVEIGLAWRLDHPQAQPSLRVLVGSFF